MILDQFSRPIPARRLTARPPRASSSAWGLYQTPRSSGESGFYRPRNVGLTDLSSALNDYEWQEILELSRQLFAQLANVGHAVIQKNLYAVGDAWIPQYLGQNSEWGAAAEEWLHNVWLPNCNLNGTSDWQSDLFLSGVAWDIDGDDVALFVIDEDGMPRIAYRSAHQIGSSTNGSSEVKGGPFDGAKLCNGIAHDSAGRFLGVRILRPRRGNDNGPQHLDVPANQCDLRFEPLWRDQVRGMPRLASALMDMMDVQDVKTFIKRGVKLDASIGLMHFNESGEADTSSDLVEERTTVSTDLAQDLKTEYRMGGEMLYMRAAVGEKLEALKSERPHQNAMEFIRGLERNGMLSVGWFLELIDPSQLRGANVRLIQDQARHSVRARQRTQTRRAKRCIHFALAQAMQTGRVPQNPDPSDWLRWGFNLPAQLSVDNGYEEQAQRENFVLGSDTLSSICQSKGKWWEDTRAQRLKENIDLVDKARVLMTTTNATASTPEDRLSLREAIALMQGTTNAPEGLRQDLNTDKATTGGDPEDDENKRAARE